MSRIDDQPEESVRGDSWAWAISLYLAAAALMILPGLGATTLVKMEGMVLDMARAMLETGDWLVPRLYGEIYTYKPPLVYWLVALSTKALGATALALRLPTALAAIVMGLAVVLLVGRTLRPRVGLLGGAAAITGMLVLTKTRLAEFDMVVASAVGIAIAAACYNLSEERGRWTPALWLLCYLALTAGVLAKGTPALMAFVPGLLVAAISTGRMREILRWDHLSSAALFGALIVAYLWLLWHAAGPVAFDQPLDEARRRGLEWTLAGVGGTLAKPLVVVAAFLPWSLLWPWGGKGLGSGRRRQATAGPEDRLLRAGWSFLAAGVAVFMAVPTQESRYYLPLSVPAAIVSALAWERSACSSRWVFRLAAGLAALLGTALVALAFRDEFAGPSRGLLATVGVGALMTLSLPAIRRSRQRVTRVLLLIALCAWVTEAWVLRPQRARSRDQRTAATALEAELPAGAVVWVPGPAGRASNSGPLYVYLDRPVRTFESAGRLPEPDSFVVLTEAEWARLSEVEPAFAARLDLVRREESPRHVFLLYRVRLPAVAGAVGGFDERGQ